MSTSGYLCRVFVHDAKTPVTGSPTKIIEVIHRSISRPPRRDDGGRGGTKKNRPALVPRFGSPPHGSGGMEELSCVIDSPWFLAADPMGEQLVEGHIQLEDDLLLYGKTSGVDHPPSDGDEQATSLSRGALNPHLADRLPGLVNDVRAIRR